MTAKQNPACNFQRITVFPHIAPIRKIFVPTGDVAIVTGDGITITIVESEIGAINNQAIFLKEVTSATGGVVYVSE